MNIYQNNAFRVLGLLTNVATKDIVARAEEIKAKKSVDVHEVYEYDFPWLGPLDRSEENISSAVQRLEDPVRRIKQELSWFWVQSQDDKDALAWLTRNRPKSAVDIWLKAGGISLSDLNQKDFNPPVTMESLTALHNLFVLLQAVLLRNELIAGKGNDMITLLDNTEQAEKDWAIALKIFNFLHDNPKYWELVQKRISDLQDRRLQNLSLDEIKESSLNNALSAHFYLITRALEKRDIGMLDKHIEILENADMSEDLYKSGLNQVLNSRIAHMNSLNEEFNRERKAIDEKGDSALYKSLFYKYRDSGKPLIEDCKIIDRKGMTDFVLSQEKFAKSFHQLSWKLNKTGDSIGALEILGEAYKNLKSEALRLECQNDASSILKDAIQQYGSEVTRRVNNSAGKGSVEDFLGVKIQYLEKVNSIFAVGQTFMTDQLQGALRDLVAAELKIISLEVKDKYQANELAENILQEAVDWASAAKKDEFKKELETIKLDWSKKNQAAPQKKTENSFGHKVGWAFVVLVIIAAVVGIRNMTMTQPPHRPTVVIVPTTAVVPPVVPPSQTQTANQNPEPQKPSRPVQIKVAEQNSEVLQNTANAAAVMATLPELPPDSAMTYNSELVQQVAAIKTEIEAHKTKIKLMEEELTLRTRETEVRQSSIDRLDNKIGTNPDSPEYNFWVGEHNELVRDQNQSIEISKELYKKYQDEFKAHQEMINSFNEKFAR